jgi:cell division protein FtsN
MFRVRVGSFKTRADADTLAAKLKSQEHFDPWVTR